MATKKKALLRPADDEVEQTHAGIDSTDTQDHPLVGTMMECPQHPGYSLKIEREGGTLFAVCNCLVRNNMFRNKRVWEYTPAEADTPTVVLSDETPVGTEGD